MLNILLLFSIGLTLKGVVFPNPDLLLKRMQKRGVTLLLLLLINTIYRIDGLLDQFLASKTRLSISLSMRENLVSLDKIQFSTLQGLRIH